MRDLSFLRLLLLTKEILCKKTLNFPAGEVNFEGETLILFSPNPAISWCCLCYCNCASFQLTFLFIRKLQAGTRLFVVLLVPMRKSSNVVGYVDKW